MTNEETSERELRAELVEGPRAALERELDPRAHRWLADALGSAHWEAAFTAAGRHVGRHRAAAARVLLLHAAAADADTAGRLYHRGDAAERLAVLRALPVLPVGAGAVGLVEDALRTNDNRLIAAAVGPYAARHLDQHLWRHAVLKCVFTGVPLARVAALADRADAELARMLADFAAERTAAGRAVPADVRELLDPPPQEL